MARQPRPVCGLVAALLAVVALVGAGSADAAVEVPFATQFASSGHGDVTVAANTLMTCPDAGGTEAGCIAARAGTATGAGLNNNGYTMERVDIDGDPTTIDSSASTLALPPGATVTFAGLYYGARTSKATGTGAVAAPDPAARGKVRMRVPGSLAYTELAAAVDDSTSISGTYAGFVDVTAQVAAAGAGEYTVANVQAGTGQDRYAGWSLIVAYSDPAAPPRSIRVYGGLASLVSSEAPLQIQINGLETPTAGTVAATVGVVAYEGDRGGSSSDRLLLAGKELFDAANPANNVFNSTIATDGVDITTKNPNYDNQLGFDADLFDAGGFLGNGATEATLEESTKIEQYLTQAVAVSIELDPEALEPPVVEPPIVEPPPLPPVPVPIPAPTPPPAEAPGGGGKHHKHEEGERGGGKDPGKPSPPPEPPSLELAVEAPGGVERPTAVVPLRITVESTGESSVRGISVCNRLPDGLTRLRAAGAQIDGAVACWKLPRLAAGAKLSVVTTARVDADTRGTLTSRTVVRAKNSRTRRREVRIRVAPLPPSACGSSLRPTGIRPARRC